MTHFILYSNYCWRICLLFNTVSSLRAGACVFVSLETVSEPDIMETFHSICEVRGYFKHKHVCKVYRYAHISLLYLNAKRDEESLFQVCGLSSALYFHWAHKARVTDVRKGKWYYGPVGSSTLQTTVGYARMDYSFVTFYICLSQSGQQVIFGRTSCARIGYCHYAETSCGLIFYEQQ